jgi:hypothetical protein
VVTRSREVRGDRRRRIAYAAAAAVVVVGGLSAAAALSGGGGDTTPAPAGPLGKLGQGAPPKIDYLDGDTFVTTSGQRFTAPTISKAADAVAWRKGVLVASQGGTGRHPFASISFVSSNGSTSGVGCGTPWFGVPAEGGAPVYWLSDGCRPDRAGRLVQDLTSTHTSKGAVFTPVGQVAGGIVSFVSATRLRLRSGAYVIPPDHRRWIPLPLMIPRGTSAAADLVSGEARNATDGLVADASTGDVEWRAHYWSLNGFSSSGRYVAGDQVVGEQAEENVGDVIGIFDASTGHLVLRKELPGLTIDSLPVWEGDDSVLVAAEDREGREAIVRIALDGSVTRTTRVVQGTPRPSSGRPPTPVLRPAATP